MVQELIIYIIIPICFFACGIWLCHRFQYEITPSVRRTKRGVWSAFFISLIVLGVKYNSLLEEAKALEQQRLEQETYLRISPEIRKFIEQLQRDMVEKIKLQGTPTYNKDARYMAVYINEEGKMVLDKEFNDSLKYYGVYSQSNDSLSYLLISYSDFEKTGTYTSMNSDTTVYHTEIRHLRVFNWSQQQYVDTLSLRGADAPIFLDSRDVPIGHVNFGDLYRHLTNSEVRMQE